MRACLHWTKCGCLWGSDMGGTRLGGFGSFSGTSAELCSSLDELMSLTKPGQIFGGCPLPFGACGQLKEFRLSHSQTQTKVYSPSCFAPILGQRLEGEDHYFS